MYSVDFLEKNNTCALVKFMGVRRNFSRGGQSRHFVSLFQCVSDATQMDVHKKNVQCYGNSSIQCFPCKKTLQWPNVLVSMDFLRLC